MKIFKYTLFTAALLALSACSEDTVVSPNTQPEVNEDGTITLDVSLAVPEMAQTNSRAMSEIPNYANLQLYIVAFAKKNDGDPTANVYINNYTATNQRVADGLVHFDVTLLQTVEPRVLHLIAVPKNVTLDLGKYGSEEIISRLSTSGGNEAYWQRVVFPNGYGTVDTDGNFTLSPDTKEKLTRVPMIRNFAQIIMTVAPEVNPADNPANFVLEGFMVVNTPTAGTVAPWGGTKFPNYLDASNNQLAYDQLDYQGILSGDATFDNTDVTDDGVKYTTASKYIYERPKSSLHPSSLIIKGNHKGTGSSYYKIDLGKADDRGIFQIFNLLRNFRYAVTITKVTSGGYATPLEALNGVTYNNLSFDIRTEKMLNISNGTAMLWVTQTSEVITKNENRTFYFGYKFKNDISKDAVDNDDIDVTELVENNPNLNGVLEKIEKMSAGYIPDGYDATQYAGYQFYRLTAKATGTSSETGTFTIVNKATGLGRKISVVVSPPFEITRNRLFAGNYNVPDQFPYNRQSWENYVECAIGSPFTIFFTLDDNLPEAIFPLVFDIEANPQNIENNPIGTLVVSEGTTAFTDTEGNPLFGTQRRIKYQKTVTWEDYNTVLSSDNHMGLIVPDKLNDHNAKVYVEDGVTKISGAKIRRVRCRFRTINAWTSNEPETTTIRITNPYFKLGRWEKKYWDGSTGGTIEASDIIELKFTREADYVFDPENVSDFDDWNSSLDIYPTTN